MRSQHSVFSDVLATMESTMRFENRSLRGRLVSGNYFSMLGVDTALGRPILPDDATVPGSQPVLVLSYTAWKNYFGEDPGVIGRKVLVRGSTFEVIGVTRPEFSGLDSSPSDFYIPLTMVSVLSRPDDLFGPAKPAMLEVIGRLRPGVSVKQATAAITSLIRSLTEHLPEGKQAGSSWLSSKATPFELTPGILMAYAPLFAAFGLVLVIACANVSNMMLARAMARQREIGVRLALGAGRIRLVRQLLTESFLLAILAGALGMACAYWTVHGALRLFLDNMPAASFPGNQRFLDLAIDHRVVYFAVLVAALATIAFGLVPALQASALGLTSALRGEFGGAFRSSRLRNSLVICQVTLCLVFLVLAASLFRTSAATQRLDMGVDVHGVVTSGLDKGYASKLAALLATQPWVDSFAGAAALPLGGRLLALPVAPAGASNVVLTGYNFVSPAYFTVIRVPILRGRNFTAQEAATQAPVTIISQAAAERFWPQEDAIGKVLRIDRPKLGPAFSPDFAEAIVIGIARNVGRDPRLGFDDRSCLYFPISASAADRYRTILIRGKGDSDTTLRSVQTAIQSVAAFAEAQPLRLEEVYARIVYPYRILALVSSVLGGLALLLTLSGMYGVMSYLVSQRSKEIGLRIALGATPGRVMRLVIAQSMRLALAGLAFGLPLSFAVLALLGKIIPLAKAGDFIAYTVALCVIAMAAFVAAFFPSLRAARVDPMSTLRTD